MTVPRTRTSSESPEREVEAPLAARGEVLVRDGTGVTLSGGGHGACLFGLGELLYLADSGRTQKPAPSPPYRRTPFCEGSALGMTRGKRPHRSLEPPTRDCAPLRDRSSHHVCGRCCPLLVFPLSPIARGSTFGVIAVWALLALSPLLATDLGKAHGVVLPRPSTRRRGRSGGRPCLQISQTTVSTT